MAGTPVHYPAGPWLRVIAQCSNDEKQWENVIWYKVTPPIPAGTDVNALATYVSGILSPVYVGMMSLGCSYRGVDVYLNNGVYTIGAHVIANVAGTQGATQLPTEDAVIVSINSGVATRAGVGRIYVGGVATSLVTESRLNTTGVTQANALATALKGIVSASGVTVKLAVWSRKLGALEPYSFTAIDGILGHRRKRRPRR